MYIFIITLHYNEHWRTSADKTKLLDFIEKKLTIKATECFILGFIKYYLTLAIQSASESVS